MKIASTIQQVKENKSNNGVKIGANAANNNGANDKSNSNAAAAKTDSVTLSKKSVALAAAAKTGNASNGKQTQKTAGVKTSEGKAEKLRDTMSSKQSELSDITKDLRKSGVGRREISKAVKSANREVNKTIGNEIKQAYKDFRGGKIGKSEFTNSLYGSAIKKLDALVSALKGLQDKKAAPAEKNTEAVKETANETKSDEATKATKETKVTDADDAVKANAEKNTEKTKEKSSETSEKAEKATPPGQVAKAGDDDDHKTSKIVSNAGKGNGPGGPGKGILDLEARPINANGKADDEFGKLVDFFNNIDKMVNGFADVDGDKVEGKGSNDEDKGDSVVNFASKLNKMFSGINKAFGNESNEGVGHRLGMAQVNRETIGRLFGADGATNGTGKIKDIASENVESSKSSFNAVRFMSSLSEGMNSALAKYKEVQDIMGEKSGAETDKSTIA